MKLGCGWVLPIALGTAAVAEGVLSQPAYVDAGDVAPSPYGFDLVMSQFAWGAKMSAWAAGTAALHAATTSMFELRSWKSDVVLFLPVDDDLGDASTTPDDDRADDSEVTANDDLTFSETVQHYDLVPEVNTVLQPLELPVTDVFAGNGATIANVDAMTTTTATVADVRLIDELSEKDHLASVALQPLPGAGDAQRSQDVQLATDGENGDGDENDDGKDVEHWKSQAHDSEKRLKALLTEYQACTDKGEDMEKVVASCRQEVEACQKAVMDSPWFSLLGMMYAKGSTAGVLIRDFFLRWCVDLVVVCVVCLLLLRLCRHVGRLASEGLMEMIASLAAECIEQAKDEMREEIRRELDLRDRGAPRQLGSKVAIT